MSPLKRRKKSTPKASTPQDLVPAEDKAGANAKFVSEAYNKVARAAKLEGLLLVNSAFEVKPNFLSDRNADDSNVNYTFDSKVSDPLINEKDGVASCTWTWMLTASIEDEVRLSITASYDAYYSNLLECEASAISRFMSRVGRFATYPYFRAHVSQLSWESSANLPLLPTISS